MASEKEAVAESPPGLKQWKSPLLSPQVVVGLTDQDDHPSSLSSLPSNDVPTVKVPESGWYGLCFTKEFIDASDSGNANGTFAEISTNQSDEERNKRREEKAAGNSNNHQKPLPEENGRVATECLPENAEFQLCIQTNKTPELTGDDMDSLQTQQNNNGSMIIVKKLDMLPLELGKLYYFPEGSLVFIRVHVPSATNITSTDTLEGNNKKECTIQSMPDTSTIWTHFKWFLLYRPLQWTISKGDDGTYNPTQPGDSSPSLVKKGIVCAICGKSFAKAKPAMNHRLQKHDKKNQDKAPKHSIQQRTSNSSTNRDVHPQELKVVFQDIHMAVIDKPQGMAVMGDKGFSLLRSDLLLSLSASPWEPKKVDAKYIATTEERQQMHFLTKPVPVHRLDAATGGLLVIAKSKESERHLKGCFANRSCQKRYRAVLRGRLEPLEGAIDLPVSNQEARTRYRVLHHYPTRFGGPSNSRDAWITVVDLFPETGRRHQLRKHMRSLGHSILGDRRYGGLILMEGKHNVTSTGTTTSTSSGGKPESDELNDGSGADALMSQLCLWAIELTLTHPVTLKEVQFVLDDPEWLDNVVRKSAPESA